MRDTLKAGMTHRLIYKVPQNKTVPHLYPEADLFQAMPEVFATGYMVGLFEWVCTEFLARHLDAGEGSLGTHVDFSHKAGTPPGLTITVEAECVEVKGARVRFRVKGHDGIDEIGGGLHERHVVNRASFDARMAAKLERAMAGVANSELRIVGEEPKGGQGEFRSYRDLQVWQDAMSLAVECYSLTRDFPTDEMFGMTSQIRRSAVSIAANVAEGHGRESTATFVHFYAWRKGRSRNWKRIFCWRGA